MSIIKLLVLIVVLAIGYRYWSGAGEPAVQANKTASIHESGFVLLPPADGARSAGVTVFAAEGCPEEAAQRADRLVEQISAKGIPVSRSSHVNFNIPQGDPAVAQTVMSIMNGELPIVLVRGRAKANPTLEDVVSEYARGAR